MVCLGVFGCRAGGGWGEKCVCVVGGVWVRSWGCLGGVWRCRGSGRGVCLGVSGGEWVCGCMAGGVWGGLHSSRMCRGVCVRG